MKPIYAAVDIKDAFGSGFASGKPFDQLGSIVSVIVQNAFVLAGIIAFVLLIFGGIGVIVSAGSGDTKKLEEGKKAMTGAVAGLLIIVASFWILQLVETLTGITLLPIK